MVKNGQVTVADAKRVGKRYWWVLPISGLACLVLAVVLIKVLPKRYTSQTVVLVDPPAVSPDIVKPVVPENLAPRLASMQQQILSRTRLEPVIQKFGLYPQDRARSSVDDLVARLRKSIEVVPMEPLARTSTQLAGFTVKVTFDNPFYAQQICSEITSMFTVESARAGVQQGEQATSFLTQQLEDAKAKLDAQDAKLAQFKQRYLGSLPDEEQTNLSLLAGMNTQLEAVTQALARAQQDKTFNQTLLEQQEANWKASQSGQNPDTVDQQLALLQDQLASLKSKYTEEHPDVVKLKVRIEELKKQMGGQTQTASANDSTSRSSSEPPQIQQLRAKLRQDDLNIADLTKRQGNVQDQIRILEARVQSSPVVEQKYKELTRNYQTALDFYNNLLKNREQAAMATHLEQQQEGEQFRVLDPASLPDTPSFPNKPAFLGGGTAAGLALGVGILFLLALSDKSLHTERDVETYLKLPVLAAVPLLELAGYASARPTVSRPQPGLDSLGTRG